MLYCSTGGKNRSDLLGSYKNVDDSPMLTALKLGKEEMSAKGRHEIWALWQYCMKSLDSPGMLTVSVNVGGLKSALLMV